jgi:hypothetical protein
VKIALNCLKYQRGEAIKLKKIINIFLAVIVFTLVCFSAIQHPSLFGNDDVKHSIAADNEFLVKDNILLIDKSNHKYFPVIPVFIFVLLLCLIIQSKFKKFIYSFIPLLKHLYLLFPIKYESRFLVHLSIHPSSI